MLTLTKLSAFQGMIAGVIIEGKRTLAIVAENENDLRNAFDKLKCSPAEKFDPTLIKKGFIAFREK